VGSIEPRLTRGRDRVELTVRSSVPADAQEMLRVRRGVAETSEEVLTQADEICMDPAEQRTSIERARAVAGNLLLVAESGGRIVGTLGMLSGDRRRAAHTCELGISVADGWRGRGVGSALMEAALAWAAAHEKIEKVCLSVFPTNAVGLALYRKFGFVEEGRRARHGRHDDGRYVDLILMARWVKGGGA
jgi:RimJ/RimL family protein N-acetyltransferase